jgi:hypothetical protein
VLSAAVSAENFDELRGMTDLLKNSLPSIVAVLGAVHEGKVLLVGTVTADLVKRGLQANNIIKPPRPAGSAAGEEAGPGWPRPAARIRLPCRKRCSWLRIWSASSWPPAAGIDSSA